MAQKGLLDGGPGAISLADLDNAKSREEINQEILTPQQEIPEEKAPEVVPTEEPVIAPKAEEPLAPEPPKEPEPEPQVEQIQKSGLDLEFLSELIGKKFESEDQVKDAFNKPTKESEYEELNKQHLDLSEKYELLLEQQDPSKYFSSDAAMKLELFKKQNPKRDPAVAQTIFSTEDLSQVDDIEMVKLGYKFNNAKLKGSEKDIEAAIAEELGVDPDTPVKEWPATAQIRLSNKASEFRDNFDNLKEGVKLPERINIDELKSQRDQAAKDQLQSLQDGWTKTAQEVLSATNNIKVPIGEPAEGEEQEYFTWDLGAAPKKDVEDLKEQYISLGLDPDGVAKGTFKEALNMALMNKYSSVIMHKYREDIISRQKEQHLTETHNPEPLKDAERTETSPEQTARDERTAFALGGFGSSLSQHPLFKQT